MSEGHLSSAIDQRQSVQENQKPVNKLKIRVCSLVEREREEDTVYLWARFEPGTNKITRPEKELVEIPRPTRLC